MTGYEPSCWNAECPQKANLWLAGWLVAVCPLWRPPTWWWDVEEETLGIVVVWDGSRRVDEVYPLYLDSLYPHRDQPITSLTTIKTLLSQPTCRSEDPHQYQYSWIVSLSWFSWPPMLINLCSMFSLFLGHDHILLHLHFVIMTIWFTVSPTLVSLLTHSLLLSIFS